jgi:uncharacterized RDD family membrane protein YckC
MSTSNPYQAPDIIDEPEFQSPPETDQIEYASRWLRLWGAILDTFIVGATSGFVFFVLGFYSKMVAQEESGQMDVIYMSLTGMTIYLVVNIPLIYTRGQTIGKMACGTVVVTKDFRQVSGNRYLFLRIVPFWFIGLVPYVDDVFGLVDSLAIFRREKNCLHDDIAGTRVIMYRDLQRLRKDTTPAAE